MGGYTKGKIQIALEFICHSLVLNGLKMTCEIIYRGNKNPEEEAGILNS
jgi:hypothetical protein